MGGVTRLTRAGRALLLAMAWSSWASAQAQRATPEPQAPDMVGLRLEDAVRLALTNNERAQKAPLRVEQAEGQVDRARGAFLPSLTAGGSGVFRATEDRSGRQLTTSGTLSLAQPLLTPSAFPQYAQASHQRDSEKWGALQDKRQLAYETARAFLQTLASERVREAAQRRADKAQANLENADARAKAALAGINDVTRARLEVANALRDVAVSEGNVQKAYLQLGFLVGRRVGPPLVPPERTTRAAENGEPASRERVQAADRRPDVRAAHERTEALAASAREPMYRLIPSLNAQAQMRLLPDPLPTENAHEETVTVNLAWNVFDAGFRYADKRTRTAQAESQALDEKLLRRSVLTDVEIATATLRAARESFRVAEEAVGIAQRSVEETEILYKQGLARAIEVNDAIARRFDAEVSRASAKLSMEQAYLEQRFALGFGPLDDDAKEARP